eukprot:731224-Heterocapsa_arctica.AAC.1
MGCHGFSTDSQVFSRVLTDCLGFCTDYMDCHVLSWAVTDSQRILKYSFGFSQTVKGSTRITWIVMDCQGLSWAATDSQRMLKYSLEFSQTVKGSARITWIVMGCTGLS